MAALTIVSVDRDGAVEALEAAAGGGDTFANAGTELLVISNEDVSDTTLTIVTTETVDGQAVADREIVIGASEKQYVGPFPTATYNDGNGTVSLQYSSVTTLSVSVLNVSVTQ